MPYKWMLSLSVLLAGAVGCVKWPGNYNLPPAEMLMHPGPGVDGPGPGVIAPEPPLSPFAAPTSQLYFRNPAGMTVTWDVSAPGAFDSQPIVVPGRYNFPQGALYRLKLTEIPGRPGVELYPTIEVAPAMPRTEAYLAHNAIPIEFSEEDLDQVLSGNFVTKVLFLPDPEFQELAVAGVETLVSTRLDPGVDPIVEADRRGSILAIIRLGNKDLQVPGMEGEAVAMYGGAMGGPAGMAAAGGACAYDGAQMAMGGMGVGPGNPSAVVSGVTTQEWGMPMSGTPIGLPGPPHIPFGIPAGLKKHVIKNNTSVHLPEPTDKINICVKQFPGMNYPKPVSHVCIEEKSYTPPAIFRQPFGDKFQMVH